MWSNYFSLGWFFFFFGCLLPEINSKGLSYMCLCKHVKSSREKPLLCSVLCFTLRHLFLMIALLFYTGYRWAVGINIIKPDKRVSWISCMCVHCLCNRASTRHTSTFYDFYITFITLADTHVLCFDDSSFSLILYLKYYFKWDEVKLKKKVPLISAKLRFCFLCVQTLKSWKQTTVCDAF